MENCSEYVNQLKKLVLQIQTRVGRLDSKTRDQLIDATKWKCPDKKERKLLTELIHRAIEYIELEKAETEKRCSKAEDEKYFSYSQWFSSISMLLGTFDVPLSKVSFNDLSLKE